MLAGLRGCNRDLCMAVVRRTDVNDVDIIALDRLAPIGRVFGEIEPGRRAAGQIFVTSTTTLREVRSGAANNSGITE
jgi:hypothetical protein